MSYSFKVRGATKAEALEAARAEMAKVVEQQPIHAVDREQALAAAELMLAVLPNDDTRDVAIALSGSVSSTDSPAIRNVRNATVTASVTRVAREGAPT